MSKKKHKKGYLSLSMLPTAVIVFAVAVIVTAIMGTVLGQIQTTQTANTVAYNVTNYGLVGLNTLATFFSPIAVIIAAVVIIGLILGAFAVTRHGGGGGV
jgi:NADH:ubiquinone oxidoreductase subunit 6 (subunit J)